MRRFLSIITIILFLILVGCSSNTTQDARAESLGLNKESIVYVTNSGECYHRSTCRYLSKSCIKIDFEEAIKEGYRPCSQCDPPAEG